MRGGEKALEVLGERFPDAELFTLVHVRGSVSAAIERLPTHTSFVQRLPLVKRWYRHYLPLFPTAIEQFSFDRFDRVISLSHCCAKSIVRPGGVPHLCYCLTPMRYAWDQFDAYFGPARLGRLGSAAMRPVMARLARWDRATSGRADRYVAISHYVAGRIRRYYNREATVVYPPVDTDFFHPDRTKPERFALVVDPSPDAFADAIAAAVDRQFDSVAIRTHAEQFSRTRFGDEMAALMAEPTAW